MKSWLSIPSMVAGTCLIFTPCWVRRIRTGPGRVPVPLHEALQNSALAKAVRDCWTFGNERRTLEIDWTAEISVVTSRGRAIRRRRKQAGQIV